jgi:hypothetical protein
VQFYDGIIGQVPWLHYLLLRNPLMMLVGPPLMLITQMAWEEVEKRKAANNDGKQKDGRDDLLAQLMRAHHGSPDKFTEGDVMAVAHGAIDHSILFLLLAQLTGCVQESSH